MDHGRGTCQDHQDEYAQLLAAVDQDTGRIVGTARTMRPSHGPLPEHIASDLNMNPMTQALIALTATGIHPQQEACLLSFHTGTP